MTLPETKETCDKYGEAGGSFPFSVAWSPFGQNRKRELMEMVRVVLVYSSTARLGFLREGATVAERCLTFLARRGSKMRVECSFSVLVST